MAALLSVHNLLLPTGQHISMHLNRGEIHSLNGPSGVGKSRLLRILADLDVPKGNMGNIRLHHKPQSAIPAIEWRQKVMLVPTDSRWWLPTAADHMRKDMSAEAERLQLDPARLDAPVTQLSTGEKSRCALLRALSREPEVLLLDEPTAALDGSSVRAVEKMVSGFAARRAVLWVTHDELQAERVADHRWELESAGFIRMH